MIAISRISRVMYLYHYFTPLFMSFVVLALVWNEIERIGTWKFTETMKQKSAILFGGIVVVSFLWYSPLTYYGLLSKNQFQLRNIFSLWDLKCVGCEGRQSMYVPGSSQ
jgi:dolichyl-phosphate-mannose--protein O-mannosyl transferase